MKKRYEDFLERMKKLHRLKSRVDAIKKTIDIFQAFDMENSISKAQHEKELKKCKKTIQVYNKGKLLGELDLDGIFDLWKLEIKENQKLKFELQSYKQQKKKDNESMDAMVITQKYNLNEIKKLKEKK